jgi:hypothetical protein
VPEFQEVPNPLGIVKKVGEFAVAVPHFTVGYVYPGRGSAKVVDTEGMRSGDHGNEIKILDSLQKHMYPVEPV